MDEELMVDDMLPEEVEAQQQREREAVIARIESFGQRLAKKREEAVAWRKASGIEDEWTAAEDAYQGIDDANRSQVTGKPSSPNGGFINTSVRTAGRSTVFLNITRPYTDAAAAKVGDMLLPTDDSPWAIKPTPIAQDAQTALTPLAMVAQQSMQEAQERAKKAAEGATKQIEDWLVECQWHGEVRKMIEDCARLGTGILKGPIPVKRFNRVTLDQGGVEVVVMEGRIAPASKCVSPWRVFPDPACGESIQDGSYVWEMDTLSAKALREMKGLPGVLDDQIDKVLEEGPGGKYKGDLLATASVRAKEDDQYEVWYFYGYADREDLEALGVDAPEGDVAVPVIVTMVNDTVVKAALNPLDTGEFPYDFMVWQRKEGVPWGTGIPAQISTPQRMLNAAARNMMDNAGYSAGPQLIMRRDAITPADGAWQITPRKIWFVNDGADVNAVNQAFMAVNIPTLQGELMNIIQFALKMAEDVTGLPMLMQGQQGQAPDTVGGMQMLLNNASVVLRRIARLFDDRVVEPHIRRYYRWLMDYGDDPSIKGDFQIDARGSSALVERDIQNQAILQMGALVNNPAFGIDPEKWFAEACKAQRLDPKRFQLDEEKKAQLAQQPPPMPPQIQAAQIRAEVEMQKAQMLAEVQQQIAQLRAQVEMQKAQLEQRAAIEKMRIDTDRDTVYVNAQMARDQANAQAKMAELQLKRELAMLEYANKRELTLEQVKAKLAETTMKLNTQKELAVLGSEAPQVATPAMEPPGRAPDGQAFQR